MTKPQREQQLDTLDAPYLGIAQRAATLAGAAPDAARHGGLIAVAEYLERRAQSLRNSARYGNARSRGRSLADADALAARAARLRTLAG